MQRLRQFLNARVLNIVRTRHQIFDVQIAAFFHQQRFIGVDTGLQRIVGKDKGEVEWLRHLEAAGLPVVFHVHDEVVIDVAPWDTEDAMLSTVCSIMGEPVPWAPDLPLKAAGWVGYYFTKD